MVKPQQLTIQKAIKKAKKAIKQGNISAAQKLYNAVLQHHPNHSIAKKGLRKLEKNLPRNQSVQTQITNPSQDQIDVLANLYYSGQITKAEKVCKELLQTFPQSLFVINVLGAVLAGQGKLQEAVQAFDKAIQLKPDYVEAYSNRGNALKELGQLKEAVDSYNIAIQIKPDYAEAYTNRGNALKELGQLKEAVESYNKAIQIKPDYAEAYSNLGNALKGLGQLKEAVDSYNKAIQIKPDYAGTYSNLGNALKKLGQLKEAVESYNKAIQIRPDYAEAYSNLGVALKELGQLKEAVESYNKAIQIKPDYAEAYSNLGNALKELGQHKEAVDSHNKAIQIKPDYAEAYSNLGVALKELGQLKEAVDSYNIAIQIKPDYAEAHLNLSALKYYKYDDPLISVMEELYTSLHMNDPSHVYMCFALAKAYDDLGEYDKCFNLLKKGNRLRKKELCYNLEHDRILIDKIKTVFNGVNQKFDIPPSPPPTIHPIFIVGMPRSGTSLVEQILASHGKVHGAGELECMNKLAIPLLSTLTENNYSQDNIKLSKEQIQLVRDDYLDALIKLKVHEKIITDKMPLNFLWIGFILSAFPNAKIIHLNRDPIATCWSIYKHLFTIKGNGYAYDMSDLTKFYKLYIDLMSFWRERFPETIYELNYENLTENQEVETHRLLEYCNLEWDEHCLDFHKTNRVVKTASVTQVRKEMYQGSSEAWRKYERQLEPLTKILTGEEK